MSLRTAALLACAAGALAAGLAVHGAFRRDMDAARAAVERRDSRILRSPYGDIEYADVGAGPAVLVIHGSGGGYDQALAFSESLRREPVRIIAPSRFGYLRSSMPEDATPEMQADALAYLLDRLGVEQAVIIGGSAGALSATQLALRHPETCRALVMVVPAVYAPGRAPETNPSDNPAVRAVVLAALRSDFLYWSMLKLAPGALVRLVLASDPALLEDAEASERRRVREILFHILPISRRVEGLAMDAATAGSPPPYPADRIRCPVLAISAEDDLYGTAAAAAYVVRESRDGRLVTYPTGGHVWIGREKPLWEEVQRFIAATTDGERAPAR